MRCEVIFASNNKGKINEIKKIFKDCEVLSLSDVNIIGSAMFSNPFSIFQLSGNKYISNAFPVEE